MKCEEYLCTSADQFGFKKAHRTELCIYTLREYIELHRKRSTTVFVTFLDASKAFDRLDHWLLFIAPKDAYKMGKHFFYIFLCVK